jgi:Zn-dependent protease/CBS domain-containing protein
MAARSAQPATGLHLGRIFGIMIVLDWSLIIIVALVTTTLSLGPLAVWHPEWSALLRWVVGFGAAGLLFASILAHELSHALVARRYGTPVERITLFLFGGMAHLDQEPPTWRAELWIALAGPAMSIVVGILFLTAAAALMDPAGVVPDAPQQTFANLGPVATLFFWAGNVNIILAIFNLVPAYPLDGGRVLRAAIWAFSGNLTTATIRAAASGQIFGWLLIAVGIMMILGVQVPIFGTGLIGGLWLGFIGWFIHRAAVMSQQQASAQQALAGVAVRDIMKRDFSTVPPDLRVDTLIEEYMMPRGQRGYPVVMDERPIGIVSFDDVRRIPRSEWAGQRVADVMTGADRLVTVDADEDCFQALAQLGQRGLNQVPVIERGKLVGLLHREDILRWIMLYGPKELRRQMPG